MTNKKIFTTQMRRFTNSYAKKQSLLSWVCIHKVQCLNIPMIRIIWTLSSEPLWRRNRELFRTLTRNEEHLVSSLFSRGDGMIGIIVSGMLSILLGQNDQLNAVPALPIISVLSSHTERLLKSLTIPDQDYTVLFYPELYETKS